MTFQFKFAHGEVMPQDFADKHGVSEEDRVTWFYDQTRADFVGGPDAVVTTSDDA